MFTQFRIFKFSTNLSIDDVIYIYIYIYMTSFKNSFTRYLLKLFPSRFSSRTLHVPSRIAGFQQGWEWSGFQALGNGTNGAGNVMLFLFSQT